MTCWWAGRIRTSNQTVMSEPSLRTIHELRYLDHRSTAFVLVWCRISLESLARAQIDGGANTNFRISRFKSACQPGNGHSRRFRTPSTKPDSFRYYARLAQSTHAIARDRVPMIPLPFDQTIGSPANRTTGTRPKAFDDEHRPRRTAD